MEPAQFLLIGLRKFGLDDWDLNAAAPAEGTVGANRPNEQQAHVSLVARDQPQMETKIRSELMLDFDP